MCTADQTVSFSTAHTLVGLLPFLLWGKTRWGDLKSMDIREIESTRETSKEQQSSSLIPILITLLALLIVGLGGWALYTTYQNNSEPSPEDTPGVICRDSAQCTGTQLCNRSTFECESAYECKQDRDCDTRYEPGHRCVGGKCRVPANAKCYSDAECRSRELGYTMCDFATNYCVSPDSTPLPPGPPIPPTPPGPSPPIPPGPPGPVPPGPSPGDGDAKCLGLNCQVCLDGPIPGGRGVCGFIMGTLPNYQGNFPTGLDTGDIVEIVDAESIWPKAVGVQSRQFVVPETARIREIHILAKPSATNAHLQILIGNNMPQALRFPLVPSPSDSVRIYRFTNPEWAFPKGQAIRILLIGQVPSNPQYKGLVGIVPGTGNELATRIIMEPSSRSLQSPRYQQAGSVMPNVPRFVSD